ncbi:MAG: glutathione S-transferase [Acidocella sp. 20-63-7]|nr:MAG: glutathione S-transferase [Acidocella sp. 20-63-7]HQT45947.1 glutathione S-transferase N-terminal domain-containing protein [Acidocella sp.]
MKLFYSPGACSLGIHVLLQEIGKPFEIEKVDFTAAAQYKPPFTSVNPKSKVPVLQRDDGSILTELPAIAFYLARSNPEKNLAPTDIEGEARALEVLDYMVATVHMRGFTRIFRPGTFTPSAVDEEHIQQTGRAIVAQGFEVLAPVLGDKDYLLGDFSVADAVLFYLEFWARRRAKTPLPPAFDAHLDRMLARPSVQRALKAEGLA